MRRQSIGVIAAAIVLLAGCDAAEPEASEVLSETAVVDLDESTDQVTEAPTPARPAASGATLIDEDFTAGPGVFFTDQGEDYDISLGDGHLELFIAGRGADDPNIVRERVDLPAPQDGLVVTASIELVARQDSGAGGYGLRCYAADDHYLFFWEAAAPPGEQPEATILRKIGDSFRVLATAPQPAALAGRRTIELRAECDTHLASDGTTLRLSVNGQRVVAAEDTARLGDGFDGVGVGGEWSGPSEPATALSGRHGGGLTMAVDRVVVRAL